jgi:2-phosphoglycerate kinase
MEAVSSDVLDWTVLLIGGPSGVGKSTVAKRIARRFGVPWLLVDDLRLALEASQVRLPDVDVTRKLYFFAQPGVWRLPPERLRDGFVGVGEAMAPAIARVVTNHLAIGEPIVLEGDGILPSLLTRPDVRWWDTGGWVRAVFVVAPDETAILANMLARGREIRGRDEAEVRKHAHVNWLYGQWLATEARRYLVPVLAPEPWETLADRIVTASGIAT